MPKAKPPAFGAIVHCELYSDDPASTKEFYEGVFGWKFEEIPEGGYWVIRAPERPHGGLLQRRRPTKPGGFDPPGTLNYIRVQSIDETTRRIVDAGGKILVPRYEIPGRGAFSIFQAPGGTIHNMVEAAPGTEWWE